MTKILFYILLLAAVLNNAAVFASETKTVLGSVPIPVRMDEGPKRFATMLDRMHAQGLEPCLLNKACAGETVVEWLTGVQDTMGVGADNTLEKLIAVQDYFAVGQFRYNRKTPEWTYQYEPIGTDNWKDVATFLKDKGGDCEDFVIVKAAALYALGFRHMKIVVLRDDSAREHHAVLAVETKNATYILDNKLSSVVHDDSLFVKSYRPLFYVDYDPEAKPEDLTVGLFGLKAEHSY
ncbi:MAG: hypothetical protein EBQ96_01355 [Proteobacteria bacterium]|nr:hypothetical protein [Pseudomonadota bacterium]